MPKEKACRSCKRIVSGEEKVCPVCGGKKFTTYWKGEVEIIDVEKSEIAKMLNIQYAGRYAIKVG